MYGDKISELVGQTLAACATVGNDEGTMYEVHFVTTDGRKATLSHHQDCCEDVNLEEVIGDLENLIGTPILVAEERSNSDDPPKAEGDGTFTYYSDSYTWTFYELRTIKGSVTLRWYGSSNGYYGEGVDFDWEQQAS